MPHAMACDRSGFVDGGRQSGLEGNGAWCSTRWPRARLLAFETFQVVDDVLDVIADSQTLGKTAGKDAASDKPTYVSLLGLERAQQYADELRVKAHAALERSGLSDTRALAALADMVVRRSH